MAKGRDGEKNNRGSGALYGSVVAVLWGLSFISIKVAVRVIPPMALTVARFVIAVAALWLIALFTRQSLAVRARDLPLLAAGGLVGVTLYFLFENNGVARLSASESSLLVAAIPVLTVLAESLFFKTRIGLRAWVGTLFSCAGVALIVLGSEAGVGADADYAARSAGFLFMAGAAVAWVLYCFLSRAASERCGGVAVTFWQSLFGLVGCLPFAFFERGGLGNPGTAVMLHVLYLGLFCSALGYWLYIKTLEYLGAGRTSVFINLIPVVSVIGAYFFLGERIGAPQIVGGLVVIIGVYLATLPGRAAGRKESA